MVWAYSNATDTKGRVGDNTKQGAYECFLKMKVGVIGKHMQNREKGKFA